MSLSEGVCGLFDLYLQTLAYEIGELEHRCMYFQKLEKGECFSPEKLDELYNRKERMPDDVEKANEGIYYRYPEIHSEIRMALSHIGRAIIGLRKQSDDAFRERLLSNSGEDRASIEEIITSCCDVPQEGDEQLSIDEAEQQLIGAQKHLLRASMDARKGQYEITKSAVSKMFDYSLKYGVNGLDSGKYISTIREAMDKGRIAYGRAKLAETLGYHDVAAEFYDEALESIDEAGSYMNLHAPSFREARSEYLEYRKKLIRRTVVKSLFGLAVFIGGRLKG